MGKKILSKLLLQIFAFQAILTLALDLTPTLTGGSMRSPLSPLGRLGAKSGHLRPPGPFHFGLGPGRRLGEIGMPRFVIEIHPSDERSEM